MPKFPIPRHEEFGDLRRTLDGQPIYSWCRTCRQPVDSVSWEDSSPLLAFVTAYPCGHSERVDGAVVSVGVITTTGPGVGPVPSISIAGYQ